MKFYFNIISGLEIAVIDDLIVDKVAKDHCDKLVYSLTGKITMNKGKVNR